MSQEDKLSIRVNVAERYYPLKIDRDDEEKIRRAAKIINEKILQYKQRYTDKDLQDFLAMVALQFSTKILEHEESIDERPLVEEIKSLNEEIDLYISSLDN
jgi:cell division protein ZapA (FtsZ GTPase activity inhibitor)